MNDIDNDIDIDPIVMYYMKLTDGGQKQKQDDEKLEVTFSEISLRLAMSHLLGKNQVVNSADVDLYKKLILLSFSEKLTNEQLVAFMSPCFDRATILELLTPKSRRTIMKEWFEFKTAKLIDIVYRDATTAMLKEYHHRLTMMLDDNVEMTLDCIETQLQNALNFLNWNMKRQQNFAKKMLNMLNSRNKSYNASTSTSLAVTSSESLTMKSIFEAIKVNLNPWLVLMVENGVSHYQSLSKINGKILHLKRLPVRSFGIDEEDDEIQRKKSAKRIIVEVEEVGSKEQEIAKLGDSLNETATEHSTNPNENKQVEANNNAQSIGVKEILVNPDATDNNQSIEIKKKDAVDFETAIFYINQLKEYALAKELYDAFVPLDQVEDCFRSA